MIRGTWLEPLVWWVLLAAPSTALCIGMYSVGQQVLRQSINDVPVMMAEDIAAGAPVPTAHVDIEQSLSPFVVLYDHNGTPVGGNGYLNGKLPTPPADVFNHPDFWAHGHSWQPQSNPEVRIDAAIVPTQTGFVLAGRNMREMERHIIHVGELMLTGWLATLVGTFVLVFIAWGLLRESK